jgi:hypothetical protein
MAMGIGNIIDAVDSISAAFTSLFGPAPSKKYPENIGGGVPVKDVTNFITDSEYKKNKDWKSSRGYAFQVYRVTRRDGAESMTPAEGWKEFRLQINPQELTQDEIFAIEVTPTFRGVLVEHHGTILKDISISGTTGMSPLRREGGAASGSGRPILSTGTSGYEEFHELRSYFRVYAEAKRLDQREGGELRMVFKNFKDNEYIYVEPQKFTMKRSAAKALMYDYSISLKGVGPARAGDKPTKGFLQSLDDTLNEVQDYMDLGTKVISGSIGLLLRVEQDIENTIMAPMQAISSALIAIRGGRNLLFGEFGITRRFMENLKREISRVENNFNDLIGRDMSQYNAAAGRTSTLVGTSRPSTYQEMQVLNALGAYKKALTNLLTTPLFDKDAFATNRAVVDTFKSKFFINTPQSTKAGRVLFGDTIQTIAARELGDPDRYRDLVILNNLKPPYIAATSSNGVLKAGDKYLVPQSKPVGPNGAIRTKEWNITKFLSESEKNLGVDIRITKDGDLAISNIKDLDLVAGIDNMVQVLSMKLFLEKGGLKRHPTLGVNLALGRKVATNHAREVRDEIIQTYSSDPRIESIPYIDVSQEGDTTNINMVVKVMELEQPVPIPISLSNT